MTSAMRRMATTWPSAPAGAAGRYSASSLSTRRSTAVSNAVSFRSTKKCTNIRTIESERATAVVSNFRPRPMMTCNIDVSGDIGIDGVQGQRDADDGAQKAEDGDRPHDQAKQAIAAMGERGIAVGKVFQFIAEAFGRTETQDVLHRRAEPAQIVFVLPMCRLAVQFRMQGSAKLIQRQLAGLDGFPGRLAQGQSLGDDIGKPQHECRHANARTAAFRHIRPGGA